MKTAYVAIISGVVGAIAGGVTSYIVTRRKYEKEFENWVSDFKDSIDHMFDEPCEEAIEEINPTDDNGQPLEMAKSSIKNQVKMEHVDYHKFYTKEMSDLDSEFLTEKDVEGKTAEEIFAEAEHPEDGTEDDIEIISYEQYEDNEMNYDNSTLLWYTEDGVVTDIEDEVIEDPRQIVGHHLDDFVDKDLGEMIFLRNNMIGCDYKIQIVKDSFDRMYRDGLIE